MADAEARDMSDLPVLNTEHRAQLMNEALESQSELISLEQAKALAHWSAFGQRGRPSPTRVLRASWKRHPFLKPRSTAWSVPVAADKLVQLLNGFYPKAMEDKWFIYADGPDVDGYVAPHMHRSWTGDEEIKLDIRTVGDSKEESEAWKAEITAVTWETDETKTKWPSEEMAKFQALEGCNWVLGVKLAEEIKEPPKWQDLPRVLPRSNQPTKTYKGMKMSEETLSQIREGEVIKFD